MSRAWSFDWVREGTARFEAAVDGLSDDEVRAPSALAGWSRAHLVTHLARNADALVNLLDWARTGVETPMYSSPGQRDADIAGGAERPVGQVRADLLDARRRLDERVAAMPEAGWDGAARTRQGRLIRGREVLWMRAREVWVHQADLGTGIAFESFPEDFLVELIGDVAGALKDPPAVRIEAAGRAWGDGPAVRGTPGAVAAWLTGRSGGGDLQTNGKLPVLPDWL